jgi:hypothetical protein
MEITKQTFLRAAEILEEKGWTTEVYHDDNGYCMLGAIASTLGVSDEDLSADKLEWDLHKKINEAIRFDRDIASWNDAQDSAEPVIAKLRELAEAAE